METTPAQSRLLAVLPETFELYEDFNTSSCPPTVVRSDSGVELYRFRRGDARAFESLETKGLIEYIAGEQVSQVVRRLYVVSR